MPKKKEALRPKGSAAKSLRTGKLPDFRNDPLDGSKRDRARACINLAEHFVAWCRREDLLARQEVDGRILPIQACDLGRTIEGNASGAPIGDPVPKDTFVAVRLGPAIYPAPVTALEDLCHLPGGVYADGEHEARTQVAVRLMSKILALTLPNFRGWTVGNFVTWCVTNSLTPKVRKGTGAPAYTPDPSEYPNLIAANDPGSPPGEPVSAGDTVIVILAPEVRGA